MLMGFSCSVVTSEQYSSNLSSQTKSVTNTIALSEFTT